MSSSTLVAHSPKFESKLVSVGELKALPEPQGMGLRHKPVPHAVLVEGFKEEIDRRGWQVEREQLALGAKGGALFGVMDLAPRPGNTELVRHEGRGVSLGFRSSTNESLSIKAVAGTRVFVCDNLALSGDMIAIQRKSTTGLDLKQAIAEGMDKFLKHLTALDVAIGKMNGIQLTDEQAKVIVFDLFDQGVAPARLFDDVSRFYFKPTSETPDTQPRTLWGLHNAVTRALRDVTPLRLFNATQHLGRVMEQVTAQREAVDALDRAAGLLVDGEVV